MTNLGRLLCAIGAHQWRALRQSQEWYGFQTIEECLRCEKSRSVTRISLIAPKPMKMHPRVQKEN